MFLILTFSVSVLSLFSNSTTVKAETLPGINRENVRIPSGRLDVIFPDGTNAWFIGQYGILSKPNGAALFCVEPGILVDNGLYSSETAGGQIIRTGVGHNQELTQEKLNDAKMIIYHGYNTSNKTTVDYMATQLTLWESLWGTRVTGASSAVTNQMQVIRDKVAGHGIKPNLSGKGLVGNTLNITEGETVTLFDSNNVVGSMKILQNTTGLALTQENNKLIVSAKNSSITNGRIVLRKYPQVSSLDASLIYSSPTGGQQVIYTADPDYMRTLLNVNVIKLSNLKLRKVGDNKEKLDGAKFKLFTAKGEPVKLRKVSDGIYNYDPVGDVLTFTTNQGEVTINKLSPGDYKIKELEAPQGYEIVDSETTVSLTGGETKDLEITNKKKLGNLKLRKVADNKEKLDGAKFQLFTAKDEPVKLRKVSDGIYNYDPVGEVLLFTTYQGEVIINKLNPGNYKIKELEAPQGYEIVDSETTVSLTGGETKDLEITNERSTTEIRKTDISGKELADAKLQVLDKNGNVIDEWTSESDKPHIIRGLHLGETYTLREDLAPLGYILSQDVEFTVNADGSTTKVNMINELSTTEIRKTDISGKELAGAKLQVLDKNGNVIDEWTSESDKTHVIRGLHVGETYTLREEFAPSGYEKAPDKEFTINADGTITKIELVNNELVTKTGESFDFKPLLILSLLSLLIIAKAFYNGRGRRNFNSKEQEIAELER